MNIPVIVVIDPKFHPDHLGFIPTFLDENDPRPAREQFNERYVYGGWRSQEGFTNEEATLFYPGDPPLKPLACFGFREEMIFVYRYGYIAIFQTDGSFEACRMD
jgi:glyoxylase-like metal-dependent hydrolase (beta-lactamase superfamily II)